MGEGEAAPLGWVIAGPAGSGKTHLIGSLRQKTWIAGGWFVLLDLVDVRDFWASAALGFVSSLQRQMPDGSSQYETILKRIVADLSVSSDIRVTVDTYTYDFGDDWRHSVRLEKLLAMKPTPKSATCIEGARSCPPEDVGGPHGYLEFLRVLFTPEPDEIEEQRHLKRWSGGRFDPERFDLAKQDKAVRGALRKRRRG